MQHIITRESVGSTKFMQVSDYSKIQKRCDKAGVKDSKMLKFALDYFQT